MSFRWVNPVVEMDMVVVIWFLLSVPFATDAITRLREGIQMQSLYQM